MLRIDIKYLCIKWKKYTEKNHMEFTFLVERDALYFEKNNTKSIKYTLI